jgi:flavorubredoxin
MWPRMLQSLPPNLKPKDLVYGVYGRRTCTPGTMMVFEESDGILFSADLFACHGPSQWQVFTDGDRTEVLKNLQKTKLGNTRYTKEALAKVEKLPVKIIASGHGSMIRENIKEYVDALLAETTFV